MKETSASQPDPPRLLGRGTAEERRLLQSASWDAAPPGARAGMEAALAPLLSAPDVPPAASGGAARSGGASAVLSPRAALLGVASVGVAVYLVAGLLTRPGAEPAVVAPQAQLAPAPDTLPLASSRAPGADALAPVLTEGAPAPSDSAPQRPHRTPSVRSHAAAAGGGSPAAGDAPAPQQPPARARPKPAPSSLLEEVRLLDTVRSALRAAELQGAAQGLAQYEQRFPRGELAREKSVLALDLLVASGQRQRAAARASALLAQPGMQRYAAHLRSILQGDASASERTRDDHAQGSNTGSAHIRARR